MVAGQGACEAVTAQQAALDTRLTTREQDTNKKLDALLTALLLTITKATPIRARLPRAR